MVKIGQHLRLPAVPNVGTDRAEVGGREHVEHLQQFGRADLHGEADDQVFVARVAAKGEVVHPQVLVDEKLDVSVSCGFSPSRQPVCSAIFSPTSR